MIKKSLSLALICATILTGVGCKNGTGSYQKFNGVDYKMIKDEPGQKAAIGDMVELNFVLKVGKYDGKSKDSIIVNTLKENAGKPIQFKIQEPRFRGDFFGALSVLSAGDSCIFRVPFDTLSKALESQHVMLAGKTGDFYVWEVKVVNVKSKDVFEKEQKDKMKVASEKDDKTLQEYFAKNNIKAEKTASGLYYTISTPGSGDAIAVKNTVSIKYKGKLLDGTVFDTNMDSSCGHTDVMPVQAGAGGMIRGFDEGVMLLKKGAKATIYMPSSLAYGENSPSPKIPAFSILVFDIDVVDVKK